MFVGNFCLLDLDPDSSRSGSRDPIESGFGYGSGSTALENVHISLDQD